MLLAIPQSSAVSVPTIFVTTREIHDITLTHLHALSLSTRGGSLTTRVRAAFGRKCDGEASRAVSPRAVVSTHGAPCRIRSRSLPDTHEPAGPCESYGNVSASLQMMVLSFELAAA